MYRLIEAEEAGRRGFAIDPTDAWAHHAVAHSLYFQVTPPFILFCFHATASDSTNAQAGTNANTNTHLHYQARLQDGIEWLEVWVQPPHASQYEHICATTLSTRCTLARHYTSHRHSIPPPFTLTIPSA